MKKSIFTRAGVLFLAIICCFSMAIPAVALTDAELPLENLTLTDAATTAGYKLSQEFQPNTQVYTVSVPDKDKMPTDAATAKGLFIIGTPEGTNVKAAYDSDPEGKVKTHLLRLTTENAAQDKSTVYYIVFTTLKTPAEQSKVADINIKKILQTAMMDDPKNEGQQIISDQVQLDTLEFKYTLTPKEIVTGTTVVGNTTIPMPDKVFDDDTIDGTVTVTTTGTTTSTMTMSGWDQTTPVLSEADATKTGKPENSKVQNGTFSITYDTVGQYVYTLKEERGTATGVSYDPTEYLVTVSVVRSDPADPTSAPVVGWIEVAKVEKNEDGSLKLDEDGNPKITKVNFGEGYDGEKYDHATAAITYPFVNTLVTKDLVISKTVTGDLGDPDQGFEFDITIDGENLAEKYTITYALPEDVDLPEGAPEEITGTVTITLKHGWSATIHELPVGTTYTVEEKGDGVANLYNTSITYDAEISQDTGDAITQVVHSKKISQSLLPTKEEVTANIVGVVNDKPLTPPTGTIADMIPYFAIVAVAVGGFTLFLVVRRRRAYDAE